VIALALIVRLSSPANAEPLSLGGFPVCEASAAVRIPCPENAEHECLLVGDNEERRRLFVYPFTPDRAGSPSAAGLDVQARRELDISGVLAAKDDFELSDIEALARLSSGEIIVYGSHSRNKHCLRRKKRRRFVGIDIGSFAVKAGSVSLVRTKKSADLSDSFGPELRGDLARVAAAVAAGERLADRGQCEQAFNIEAAFVVSAAEGDQVWVGLRRPLVDGHAVLLRHEVGRASLRFVEARLVELGGEGFRGLDVANGFVWGIATRRAPESSMTSALWRFPVEALAGEGPIVAEQAGELPKASEGLAIFGDQAVVVMDGKQSGDRCIERAGYVVVPIPTH
jgi:hypothetical protein